jgi:hypothetical protein
LQQQGHGGAAEEAAGKFTPCRGRGCGAKLAASASGGPESRMSLEDPARITAQLVDLKVEHRDLDAAISRLAATIEADELAIKRLKKRKLKIKDMIAALESRLIPDLDA